MTPIDDKFTIRIQLPNGEPHTLDMSDIPEMEASFVAYKQLTCQHPDILGRINRLIAACQSNGWSPADATVALLGAGARMSVQDRWRPDEAAELVSCHHGMAVACETINARAVKAAKDATQPNVKLVYVD